MLGEAAGSCGPPVESSSAMDNAGQTRPIDFVLDAITSRDSSRRFFSACGM